MQHHWMWLCVLLVGCQTLTPTTQPGTGDVAEKIPSVLATPVEFSGWEGETRRPDELSEIRIGLFAPTDADDSIGGPLHRAISLAIEQINMAGGFDGVPLRLVSRWSDDPWRGGSKEMIKLVDLGLQQAGLIKGARIYDYMMERLGPDLTFDDLGLPIALVAADMITGQQVILQEGPLVDAIRATISVPGVFVPVERGSYKLVDGGILNNVPADVVRDLGADIVIAVDVMDYYGKDHRGSPSVRGQLPFDFVPQYLEDLWQVQMIMIDTLTEFRFQRAKPDIVIRPELPDEITLFVGFHRGAEAIAAGEAAAEEVVPQIKGLLAQ